MTSSAAITDDSVARLVSGCDPYERKPAVSGLFKEMGDEQTKRMRIAVPCNIRWKYYDTYEEVKLENKIAPMALKIDLESDP